MDRDYVKMIITTKDNKDKRLIMNGDFIDNELFEELFRAQEKLASKAFYAYDTTKNVKYSYDVEMKCVDCGDKYIENASKTALFNTFRKLRGSINFYGKTLNERCDKCLIKLQDKEKEEERKKEESRRARVACDTFSYITDVLNPENSFNDDVSAKDKINTIMCVGYADELEIKREICSMLYSDFLKTPYWEGVRCYKLRKAGYSCELCATKGRLNVHHRTYKNHGLEHRREVANNDLVVLCEKCHKKFHDILEKEAK